MYTIRELSDCIQQRLQAENLGHVSAKRAGEWVVEAGLLDGHSLGNRPIRRILKCLIESDQLGRFPGARLERTANGQPRYNIYPICG